MSLEIATLSETTGRLTSGKREEGGVEGEGGRGEGEGGRGREVEEFYAYRLFLECRKVVLPKTGFVRS